MYSTYGGDTVQVENTAKELRKLGVAADIFRADATIRYENYDLLHFFNIIRPADHLSHAIKSGKPYLISTIYLDYRGFDQNARGKAYQLLFKTAGVSGAEYIKKIFRFIRRQDKLISPEYLFGHNRTIKKLLAGAAMILPNSASEERRVRNDFGYRGHSSVIPNGVDKEVFGAIPKNVNRENKVICVAQIFGMKNQHAVIKACSRLKIPLDIIGKPPPNHSRYYNFCKSIAGSSVRFLDFVPQKELPSFYAAAKVHALPSWYETTGLSSLEAGSMGCNLVVSSCGDTSDYFAGVAEFCEPDNQQSIDEAIAKALQKPEAIHLREHIMKNYTWENAAATTLAAYQKVMKNLP
jgi:glycosyltransferase involved in cell wall biosynthesis